MRGVGCLIDCLYLCLCMSLCGDSSCQGNECSQCRPTVMYQYEPDTRQITPDRLCGVAEEHSHINVTVGDRAIPVAGSRLWNSLPHVVTSAPLLAVFRKRLKTSFFSFVRFVTDTPCGRLFQRRLPVTGNARLPISYVNMY